MECKDEFRQLLKQQCPNGGGSRYHSNCWGCTCCVPFRVVGKNNGRKIMRRKARRSLKRSDSKMVLE